MMSWLPGMSTMVEKKISAPRKNSTSGKSTARPTLAIEAFNPRLMTAYLFTQGMQHPAGKRFPLRCPLDYELEYILESSGSEVIEGTLYPVKKGDIVFRRPGQITQGIMPYKCFTIIFSLDGNTERKRPEVYMRVPMGLEENEPWEVHPDYQSSFLEVLPTVFHTSSGDIYRTLLDTILKHHISPGEGSELVCKASILQLLVHLHTEVQAPLHRHQPSGSGDTKNSENARYRKLEKVLAFMHRNFRRKLPLEELAQVASLSPTWLHRIFSETMGETPLDHLNRLRIEKARELLATSDLSASSVATECGFENVPYFFTLFKRSCNETPAQFRARHQFPV